MHTHTHLGLSVSDCLAASRDCTALLWLDLCMKTVPPRATAHPKMGKYAMIVLAIAMSQNGSAANATGMS